MSEFVSERIGPEHDPSGFDSGNPILNTWLRDTALRADAQGTARTRVWTRPDDPAVVAYYAVDDNATAFYRAHGFIEIAGSSRLYVRISALRSLFDLN